MAKQIVWTNELLSKLFDEVFDLWVKELKEWADFSIRLAIDVFYDDYDPEYYHRKFRLYDAYEIKTSKDFIGWEVDSKFLNDTYGDNGETDYVYEIAFEGVDGYAYHGGEIHPKKGVPYWKTGKHFTKWGKRAARMKPPIEELIQKNLDEVNLVDVYTKVLLKVKKKYERMGR